MAQKNKGGLAILHRHYDKIVAVLVLVGLLVSLLYLSQSSRRRRNDAREFDQDLSTLRPAHPDSVAVDASPYQQAQQRISDPYQMQDATNRPFLVAQQRVWCIECRQPIHIDASACPFCGKKQPDDEDPADWDSDGDGIPDAVERQFGLNPLDAADAGLDLDGDGFSNLEEHQAKTLIADATVHPPRVAFLRVQGIVEVPFQLVLLGTFRGPDGRIRYQIKDTGLNQDFYVYEGQDIGPSGFKLSKGEVRKEMRKVEGWKDPREVEIHFVTVVRGTSTVVLEAGAPGKSSEYKVTFQCTKDRTSIDYTATSGGKLTFDKEEYEVISVDRPRGTVVIRRLSDQEEIAVPKL